MNEEFRIELEMEQRMCKACRKSNSEYYEMVLHLRYKFFEMAYKGLEGEEAILLVKEECMKVLNEFNSINKLEEVDNGFDVYFKDHGQMNKLLTLFGRRFKVLVEKRTNKIMGRDNLTSKDLFRHFQSLILINLNKGDLVQIKGEEYKIKAINKGGQLVVLKEENGAKKIVSYEMIQDYFQLLKKAEYTSKKIDE
jgi:NMD protein affecting ribosome stability and mRNA decay